MADAKSRMPSRQTVRELARLVGLNLTEEQLDKLTPDIEALARNIAGLEALDLGETEPALVFQPDLWAD